MRCLEVLRGIYLGIYFILFIYLLGIYRWLTQLIVHWLGYPEVSWEQDNKEERWSENLFLKVIKLTNGTMTPRGMK